MDVSSVIPVKEKIMIEKWLLVLLIVGGTSLVFLVCFPIDFYLYRRRKRLARERSSAHDKKPIQVYRAGQCHAQVYPDSLTGDVEVEGKGAGGRNGRSQNRFVRMLNLFRKRKTEERLMQLQKLTESKSESSSSDQPTVYINTETHDETRSVVKTPDGGSTDIPGSVEPHLGVFTTGLVSSQMEASLEYQGYKEVEFKFHENTSQDHIPYMARALSVMMSENEELFGPESKHLNYGSTEKVNGVHVNRKIYESLNKAFVSEDAMIVTTAQTQGHTTLLSDDGTSRPSPTETVLVQDSGESSTDYNDKTLDENASRENNIIKVKSGDAKGTLNTKPPKGHPVKRSKPTRKDEIFTEMSEGASNICDIEPSPLPEGIVTFKLSDTDDTDSDGAASDSSLKQSDQYLDTGQVTDEGKASPLFRPVANSFSDQYLSKDKLFGRKLNTLPTTGGDFVDEFMDVGRTSIDMNASNFSFLEDAAMASRRKKRKKKSEQSHSANSLPNLMNKTRIMTKQDYYKDRRAVSAANKDLKFSRY